MTILSVADQTDNTLWGVAPPKNAEALTANQKIALTSKLVRGWQPNCATELGICRMISIKPSIAPQVSFETSWTQSETSLVEYRGLVESVVDGPWDPASSKLLDMLLVELMAAGP